MARPCERRERLKAWQHHGGILSEATALSRVYKQFGRSKAFWKSLTYAMVWAAALSNLKLDRQAKPLSAMAGYTQILF